MGWRLTVHRAGHLGTHGPLAALNKNRQGSGGICATRVFVRRVGLDLYFNRVPSLPATDDGSARPLAEHSSTGPGGGEDIAWEAGTEPGTPADTDEEPGTDGGEPVSGGPVPGEPSATGHAVAGHVVAGHAAEEPPAGKPQSAGPLAAGLLAAGLLAAGPLAAGPLAAGPQSAGPLAAGPPVGESGRWFRPARKAESGFLAIPADGQAGLATPETEPQVAAADAAVPAPGRAGPGAADTADTDTAGEATGMDAAPASTLPWRDGPVHPDGAGRPAHPDGTGRPAHPDSPGGVPGARGVSLAPPPDRGAETKEKDETGKGETGKGETGKGETGKGETGKGAGEEERGALRTAARRRISRRRTLQAGLLGGAGVAALPLLALVGGITRTGGQPTDLTFTINTNWLFGGQYMAGSESRFYDDSNFAPVAVPHAVTQLSWENWDYSAWQQLWIYRRHFTGGHLLDPRRPGNRIIVDFDGVMVNASVTINDQLAATHQGGYLPFSAELTGKVTAGDNLLAVVVDARCLPVPPVGASCGPGSIDFLQPGGIYRDVRLRVLPQVFLSDLFAQPADVLTGQPRVDIECTLDSAATTHLTGALLVELLDGPARVTAQVANVAVSSPGTSTAALSLTGFGPVSLWSPDSPKLYTVRATLNFPGLGSHVLSRRIGFREASFRPEGFFLNGNRLPLFGLNRHQLYPYAGMAMPARAQRKDVEILKNEFNCNMVRCSHYPQSPAFLDACDELGVLVWEEAPGWHNVTTTPAWQDLVVQNVRDMVIRDRSRPSVVIWGTRLNETRDHPALWAATRQAARELDGSRPSSGAMAFHEDIAWSEDVYAYDDYGIDGKGNVALKPPFPGLPYLVTEAVGVEPVRPQHFAWTDPPAWLARQAALHGQAQSQARSSTGYAGLLGWAGFDYASLLGQGPGDVKWAGVADGFRVPKPGAAIYQAQGDPAVRPVIVPVFFWEPVGAIPAPAPTAMIASNCERLEVFVGGTHVTSALPAFGSPLYSGLIHPPFLVDLPGRIPNPAPDLLVLGFVGGRQVAQLQMSASPAGDALVLAADDTAITADGSDATRAVFRAVDAYGNQRRYGSGVIALTLSGPATLVGDNPFAFGRYGGLGAVWVRSQAGQPGAITLTASHPLLGQAEVQVRSEPANQLNELA